MYGQLHILSPIVEARYFFFIGCYRKLDQRTWIMLGFSYDLFNEIQTIAISYPWKFSFGCVIQDMGNGASMERINFPISLPNFHKRTQLYHIFQQDLFSQLECMTDMSTCSLFSKKLIT